MLIITRTRGHVRYTSTSRFIWVWFTTLYDEINILSVPMPKVPRVVLVRPLSYRTSRKLPEGSSPPKWDLCRLSLLHKQQYTRSNSFPTWLQLKRNVCLVIIREIGGHHGQAAKAWMWTWARNKGIWSSKSTVTMKPTLARKKMFTHLQIPMILNKTTAFPFISGKTCDV